MKGRLQFRYNETLFATRDLAISYLDSQMSSVENKIALLAEPLILKYGSDSLNPNIILAIGSVGDGITSGVDNKYFIIDTATINADIANLAEQIGDSGDLFTELSNAIDTLKTKDVEIEGKITALQTAIDNEILRATEAEAALIVTIQDTNSINLTSVPSVTGNTISADIKLSALPNNQLEILDESVGGGMFYTVSLDYATGTDNGILTLSVNGKVVDTINLPLERFLESASYDAGNKELVFVFTDENGEDYTVRIPVADLVDEYIAGLGIIIDSANTISLNINTTATEPFLVVDSNGIAIKGVQTAINAAVTTEHDRALAEETALKTNLSGLTNNFGVLRTDLTNEISRATTREDNILSSGKTYTDTEINALKLTTTNNIANAVIETKAYSDAEDDVLAAEIARVDAKSILATSSNAALTMSANRATNGDVTINGRVEVSPNSAGLVIANDGLTVQLGLEYTNGILKLTNPLNGALVASTSIAMGGLLQDVSYDSTTQTLTLIFALGDGTTDVQYISLAGLVNEWVVDNTKLGGDGYHTAVEMVKEVATGSTGVDIVYADVNIVANNPYGAMNYSPTNNILAKHSDATNGYLYVDGLAKFIKTNSGDYLENVLTNIKNDITTVSGNSSNFATDINQLSGQTIVGGTYDAAASTLTLTKNNNTTITVGGFADATANLVEEAPDNGTIYGRKNETWVPITDGLSGNLVGITGTVSNNLITLTDNSGHTVNIDLTQTITNAVNQALTDVFKPSRFLATDNDKEVKVTVDSVAQTVTFGFGDNTTINAGTY